MKAGVGSKSAINDSSLSPKETCMLVILAESDLAFRVKDSLILPHLVVRSRGGPQVSIMDKKLINQIQETSCGCAALTFISDLFVRQYM